MKRLFSLIACILATIFSVSAFSGCGAPSGSDEVVLYIFNYDGGVGHKWLDSAIARFNEDNAETVYGDKSGYRIEVTNEKNAAPLDTIKTSFYSLYFWQGVKFNSEQAAGKFLNISDIVKEIGNDTREYSERSDKKVSIADKMSQNMRDALTAYDGNYYVLPHYEVFNGVVYNKTLFEQNGWYFAKNVSDYKNTNSTHYAYGFVSDAKKFDLDARTCGPNGIAGDYDDGLPSSIEELDRLCNYITRTQVGEKKCLPFAWYDGGESYQTSFATALYASLEGYDGAMANFTLNSNDKTTRIIRSFDADSGQPSEVDEVKITIAENNFYELYQQESRYYTLSFLEKIFKEGSGYYGSSSADGGNTSQTDHQYNFMTSMYDSNQQPIAMLLEGSYWLNEAKDSGDYAEAVKFDSRIKDIEFGFMPLPVKAKGTVQVGDGTGREPVVVDSLESFAFINANVERKHGKAVKDLALDFLKFLYTDESLRDFTLKSSVGKSLDYTLTSGDLVELEKLPNGFASTVNNIKEKGSILNHYSKEKLVRNNSSIFSLYPGDDFWKVSGGANPYAAFGPKVKSPISARRYFDRLKKTQTWADGLKNAVK